MDEFVSGRAIQTEQLTGRLYPGCGPEPHHGVVILHGGGGAGGYERTYAARLAEHGYTTLCADYFGAPGVSDTLSEIPLSYFQGAGEWLLERPSVAGEHVGVIGFSRGGEASLLVGSHFECIGAVVAYVPSCYVFPAPTWMDGIDEERAAWTLNGEPIPYLPVDEHVEATHDGAEEALGTDASNASRNPIEQATDEQLRQATIAVEDIEGPVLLVSGGSDQVWSSTELANRASERLADHDHPWEVEHLAYPEAGHAIRVPYRLGETDASKSQHGFGGTNAANAYASADAWQNTLRYLQHGLRE